MEIFVENTQSARNAADGGATRLLLCSAIVEGGVTPTVGMLRAIKEKVHIPIFCMLRCRPGHFCYTPEEVTAMKTDAKLLVENGADGIAFGALTKEGTVDQEVCKQIMEVVPEGVEMTFNRAFDWTHDPTQALLDIHSLGRFTRIVTSGHAASALEGMELLQQLVNEVKQGGFKIKIVPTKGVDCKSIIGLVAKSGCVEFQSSSCTQCKFMGHHNPLCKIGMQDCVRYIVQKKVVSYMASIVKSNNMDVKWREEDEERQRAKYAKYQEVYLANKAMLEREYAFLGEEHIERVANRCKHFLLRLPSESEDGEEDY